MRYFRAPDGLPAVSILLVLVLHTHPVLRRPAAILNVTVERPFVSLGRRLTRRLAGIEPVAPPRLDAPDSPAAVVSAT